MFAAFGLPATFPVLLDPGRLVRVVELAATLDDDDAGDADFWSEIARAFTVDRSVVNLNNGGVSPSPAWVQEAMKRHLDFSNLLPSHNLWSVLEPRRETVRTRLARLHGVDPEEIAITRNASEGLQICQFGLDLERGDHVLTTNQDYPRMLATFEQRVRREGIVLDKIRLPVPCEDDDEVVRRFEEGITPRTRMILISHVINLTGQILPVRRVVELGRAHGIPVIVDGAHSFANMDFRLADLDCDYFATSLHKWLFAPHGTGLLYVRRDKIEGLWPLMAADESLANDIRKFEQIGTHPAANHLAIAEALTFHEALGPARKEARLLELRDHWMKRLATHDRVHFNTSRRPGFGCGIANFRVDGLDTADLRGWLWREHHILQIAIRHEDIDGLRISPSVYTTFEELERFCDAVEDAIANGLPS